MLSIAGIKPTTSPLFLFNFLKTNIRKTSGPSSTDHIITISSYHHHIIIISSSNCHPHVPIACVPGWEQWRDVNDWQRGSWRRTTSPHVMKKLLHDALTHLLLIFCCSSSPFSLVGNGIPAININHQDEAKILFFPTSRFHVLFL